MTHKLGAAENIVGPFEYQRRDYGEGDNMTAQHTPWDAECAKHVNDPRPLHKRPHQEQLDYAEVWGKREGYLRAKAADAALLEAAKLALEDSQGGVYMSKRARLALLAAVAAVEDGNAEEANRRAKRIASFRTVDMEL